MTKLFQPKVDITAYELAVILMYDPGAPSPFWSRRPPGPHIVFSLEEWAKLPPEMQRHFQDQPA